MSKTAKVDKDYVEKIVAEDLKRKYPDITELEFTAVTRLYKNWVAFGRFSTSRGFSRGFMYSVDEKTGEILGYTIYQ
jgi:hypothetical protein